MMSRSLTHRIFGQVAGIGLNFRTALCFLWMDRPVRDIMLNTAFLQKSGSAEVLMGAACATLHEYNCAAQTQDSPQKPCDQA